MGVVKTSRVWMRKNDAAHPHVQNFVTQILVAVKPRLKKKRTMWKLFRENLWKFCLNFRTLETDLQEIVIRTYLMYRTKIDSLGL